MPRDIVPDACALAASLFNEPLSGHANPLLAAIRSREVDAVAPALGLAEFFNICRKKRAHPLGNPPLSEAVIDVVVADFLALPIVWVDMERLAPAAWSLHRTRRIQTADAFYVVVAQEWSAELWTADAQLFQAARTLPIAAYDLNAAVFV